MYKITVGMMTILSAAFGSSDIVYNYGEKSYTNSKLKIDGIEQTLAIGYNYGDGKITIGFSKDEVNLKPKAKSSKLEVEKLSFNIRENLSDNLNVKLSYIGIQDNLAPTDDGKVYGVGTRYNILKGFGILFDGYKSDYNQFKVNQYDVGIFKNLKIGEVQSKVTLGTKIIKIDGDKYGKYTFRDKDYQTNFISINGNYNGYFGGMSAMFGERIFTVMDDGNKVQHHAMEQDKTYMASFGKKFEKFDIVAKYSYQNGKELPENKDDVETKVTSLMLKYKF